MDKYIKIDDLLTNLKTFTILDHHNIKESLEKIKNENYKYIKFHYCDLVDIKDLNYIPDCVIAIKLFDCYVKNIIKILPSNLKYLDFGMNNQYDEPLINLPINLEYLHVGFNYQYSYINFPLNIKYLILNCSVSVDLSDLPYGIEELIVTNGNKDIIIKHLPNSIKYLEINSDHYYIEKLSNNLKFLKLNCNLYNLSSNLILPESLEYLEFWAIDNIDFIYRILNLIPKTNEFKKNDSDNNIKYMYETNLKKIIINTNNNLIDTNIKKSIEDIPFIIKNIDIQSGIDDDYYPISSIIIELE